jgi:hypothetical protein
VRRRSPDEQRRLTHEQRNALLRHIAAVPNEAGPGHPTVQSLIAFRRTLDVPWWAPGGTAYLRVGGMCADGRTNVAVGLAKLRMLASCEDWGDAPRG